MLLTADLRPVYSEYDSLALKIIGVTAFIMLWAVIIGLFFAGRIVRPITRLVDVAQKFSWAFALRSMIMVLASQRWSN
ncbi:MAG: hypothetical protein WEB02_11755 [Methylophaga sp.]